MKSLRHASLAVSMALLAAFSCTAPASAQEAIPKEVDQSISSFFATIKQGQGSKAMQDLLGTSSLWERTGIKEQMTAQLETAIKIYGPLQSYECPALYRTGTLFLRRYCYAQHQELVMRWQFDFLKSGKGWIPSYLAFTDQSNTWPDSES